MKINIHQIEAILSKMFSTTQNLPITSLNEPMNSITNKTDHIWSKICNTTIMSQNEQWQSIKRKTEPTCLKLFSTVQSQSTPVWVQIQMYHQNPFLTKLSSFGLKIFSIIQNLPSHVQMTN